MEKSTGVNLVDLHMICEGVD